MNFLRRVPHALFTAFAALSFLALVAVVALWLRSHRVTDGWAWSDGVLVPTAGYHISWRKSLLSHSGKVYYIADRNMGGAKPDSRRLDPKQARFAHEFGYVMQARMAKPSVERRVLGFEHLRYSGYPMIASTRIGPPVELTRIWVAPYWAAALVAALLPGAWVVGWGRRRRRARRLRAGLCAGCGYDLRASAGRCPECGASR